MDTIETIKAIGSKLMGVAPALAGAVLSPNPATVVNALGAIKKALGLSPDAPEVEIDATLAADPETRLKLTVAENEYRISIRKADNEELIARLTDVQNARSMAVESVRVTGRRDRNLYIIAYTILGGYLGMVTFLLFMLYMGKPIKDETGILFMLMGNLSTFAGMVLGYFYGTTKGSAEKTELLHNSTPIR